MRRAASQKAVRVHWYRRQANYTRPSRLAHAYYFRLSQIKDRQEYWETLIKAEKQLSSSFMPHSPKVCESLLKAAQMDCCEAMVLEEGIALNDALRENLFVMVVCIFNRIPVFVVGRPGSSKSLAMSAVRRLPYS